MNLIDILKQILLEEKKKADRCKRIADRKYDKPSAYKSGAIVRCRKGNIWKDLKEDNQPSEESYQQALKDIKPIIPVLSHNIIHQQGLEHNEENMVKSNQKIFDLVKNGDNNTLDQLWDLAGNSLLRNAINIITFYHKSNLTEDLIQETMTVYRVGEIPYDENSFFVTPDYKTWVKFYPGEKIYKITTNKLYLPLRDKSFSSFDELRSKYKKGEFTNDDIAYINPEESGIQNFEQYEIGRAHV